MSSKKYQPNTIWYFEDETPKSWSRPLLDSERTLILQLTEVYSAELWTRYISTRTHHIMLMTKDDWSGFVLGEQLSIPQHWDTLQGWDAFAQNISALVPFKPQTTIYFFWQKQEAVETTWEIFLKHWPRFLLEDEADILIAPESLTGIIFSLGNIQLIRRGAAE